MMILHDNAIVIRGGQSSCTQIERSLQVSPSGELILAATSSCDASIEELCRFLPHSMVRSSTVGSIRHFGGDVIRAAGRNPHHANIILGRRGAAAACGELARIFGAVSDLKEGEPDKSDKNNYIFADFNNINSLGFVRLNTVGSSQDLKEVVGKLVHGEQIILYDGELIISSIFYVNNNEFVAEVDWESL